jgi:hypothetical protein
MNTIRHSLKQKAPTRQLTIRGIWILLGLFFIGLSSCSWRSRPKEIQPPEPLPITSSLVISFDYAKQSGSASNQFAVWIEDESEECVRTLYATRFTADGGYELRPESIPTWVEKAILKSNVDAISGATPKAGTLSYTWDFTDDTGNPVDVTGTYTFFIEASLRWNNRVLFSGEVDANSGTVTLCETPEYHFEASDGHDALGPDSPENLMITSVTAEFFPAP